MLTATSKRDGLGGSRFAVVKLSGADGALRWQQSTPESGAALAMAVDGAGHALAAGYRQITPPSIELLVAKLDGATGTELWRYTLADSAGEAVVVDANGDVIVAGNSVVAKLRGSDGAELWRFGDLIASAVTIDGAGDVFAGGTTVTPSPATYLDFSVVKLAGSSGALLWRREVDGTAHYFDRANAVATDAAGNVVAAGEVQNGLPGNTVPLVIKLDGTDGDELWRYELPQGIFRDVTVDSAGNPMATGTTRVIGPPFEQFLTVVSLAAASGAESWRADVSPLPGSTFNLGEGLVLDGSGDLVAVGATQPMSSGGGDIAVVKFAGDGTERWREAVSGRAPFAAEGASDVALDPAGNVIACGSTDSAFTVVKLGERVGGKRIVVRDAANTQEKGLWVRSSDRAVFSPVSGSGGDPTIHGGSLELRNPTTGEAALFDLPPENWRLLGTATRPKGYGYRDADSSSGPCTRVDVRDKGTFKAVCRGSQISFTLNESNQGTLITHLRIGGQNLCMRFGGTVVQDTGILLGAPGIFSARDAGASAVCP